MYAIYWDNHNWTFIGKWWDRTIICRKNPNTLKNIILNEDINNYVQTETMTITWEREHALEVARQQQTQPIIDNQWSAGAREREQTKKLF